MNIFSELLKYGVIQAILPSILAIAIVYVTKNHESKVKKDTYIFKKKREAFSNVLSRITKIIISIQANFSWEENKYYWISEKDCDDFQLEVEKEKHYLNNDDISVIQLIMETLRKNSSWQSNVISWEESIGFSVNDISLIEYLYKILSENFRNFLLNKQTEKNNKSITFLKICCLLHNYENT